MFRLALDLLYMAFFYNSFRLGWKKNNFFFEEYNNLCK